VVRTGPDDDDELDLPVNELTGQHDVGEGCRDVDAALVGDQGEPS
jgi:hypothetical protein